ncbi:hypothetical protein [Desulfosporosinus sp. OT]|uniref:hypothetical protein n=1 Tax=Desulfosporosinus sp. OT TaxID=913865 RepID=UPI000223B0CE|nr:hypothetical protein [Desulfosporosinus sp. OT]EGW38142.1 hypothetical protein DOT_3900 [Desulfosporosinus sp. OT]
MGGNPIQFDYTFLFAALLPLLFYLMLFIFAIYLMISTIKYFKRKSLVDKELLQKLDELIKLQTQHSEHKS